MQQTDETKTIKQEQDWWICPPPQLTFDELLSGKYGLNRGYVERFGRWQYLLESGWFYTGNIGEEAARRCDPANRLDWMTL